MNLEISHRTRYEYDREVRVLPHLLYLRPRENPLLHVQRFAFSFEPAARIEWMRDDFDNLPASAQFTREVDALEIGSSCQVTTHDTQPFDFSLREYAATVPFAYEPLHRFNLTIYLAPPDHGTQEALHHWLAVHFTARPPETVAWLIALNQVVSRTLTYRRRDEPGIQSSRGTIAAGSGSCRDFAVLLVECARTLGFAARFVSGYLFDPANNGSTAGAMHAWAEVFLPGAGWRGLDPTHGIFCHNAYVPVAHAVVAESVNPIQGSFFSAVPARAAMCADVRIRQLA